jgi:hypothetical protein
MAGETGLNHLSWLIYGSKYRTRTSKGWLIYGCKARTRKLKGWLIYGSKDRTRTVRLAIYDSKERTRISKDWLIYGSKTGLEHRGQGFLWQYTQDERQPYIVCLINGSIFVLLVRRIETQCLAPLSRY